MHIRPVSLRIHLFDADAVLGGRLEELCTERLGRAVEVIRPASPVEAISRMAGGGDVAVVDVGTTEGWSALGWLAIRQRAPMVIAVAGEMKPGESLEYLLLRAELHGAAAALAKPIDADELLATVLELAVRQKPELRELERLLHNPPGRSAA